MPDDLVSELGGELQIEREQVVPSFEHSFYLETKNKEMCPSGIKPATENKETNNRGFPSRRTAATAPVNKATPRLSHKAPRPATSKLGLHAP
jgi:hypothetical protein